MEVRKYNIKKARKIQVRLFEKFLKIKGVYGKFIKGFNDYYGRFNEPYYRFRTWNYDYYSMNDYKATTPTVEITNVENEIVVSEENETSEMEERE